MGKIIVVGGIKGGCGKTTIATNLTSLFAKEDRVLLIDADEQKSSFDWANQRESIVKEAPKFTTICLYGRSVADQTLKMVDNYETIIIDVGGRDTTSQRAALCVADIFLIPFRPRVYDVWTLGTLKAMIAEIKMINQKLKIVAFLNQADYSGNDNDEAMAIIEECEDISCFKSPIALRKAFANAAADGLGVGEVKNTDEKAILEIENLFQYVVKLLK